MKNGDYIIVRSYAAGVLAGTLKSKKEKEVILKKARRLWYWKGAASLSELAMSGVKNPDECKFPEEVTEVTITEACEILSVSAKAKKSIAKVPVWRS
jgi:hypothetical protein